ncbi:probable WRKY transcription factor 25 [Zingiber officinale]|uniref:probable WRKY transcription factor 25 n=1 Tax=Zingiber officinale TaxID=94328 RepID=UPI001C4C413A|nr:probable WRKY transcription factor 25 [Zingiber officinale]
MQFGKPQAHAADPPSLAPEDSWRCGHRVAIRDINRAHDLMTQLQAVLLQFPVGSTWSQLGGDIIKDILKLTASALSALQSSEGIAGEKRTTTWGRKKRRRVEEEKWAVVTTVPYEDGRQWRKYGQKAINNTEHPRSYFRCTYKEEQGCEAKKTVQQEDGHADPPKFTVEYTARHTCKLSESTTGLPFQKLSWPLPTSDRLITSSSSSSSPSLVAASTDAKVDDQSYENVFFNGDLDMSRARADPPSQLQLNRNCNPAVFDCDPSPDSHSHSNYSLGWDRRPKVARRPPLAWLPTAWTSAHLQQPPTICPNSNYNLNENPNPRRDHSQLQSDSIHDPTVITKGIKRGVWKSESKDPLSPCVCTQVHDEMLDDWDWDWELDMLFGDE